MLRQAENRVRIEGILSEINLKYGSYVKNGVTVDTVGGDIKVLVNQQINGEDVSLIIPVYMFASKLTNAGKPNPAYASIESVMKEYVSIASGAGEAGADRVRITSGSIRMNEYWNQQGQLISFPRAVKVEDQLVMKRIAEVERDDIRRRAVVHAQIQDLHPVKHRANNLPVPNLPVFLPHSALHSHRLLRLSIARKQRGRQAS